jgi:uncharacterized membrane protein YphA (DoxX/SURF4 family)
MNIALWIVQGLLGLLFLMVGSMKLMQPKEKLAERMGWVKDFSAGTVRLIGTFEVLCAIGIVLPSLTGILPWLSPVAAVGLVLTMIGAAITHARRNEYQMIITNMVLLLLAAFVVYGRFVAVPM